MNLAPGSVGPTRTVMLVLAPAFIAPPTRDVCAYGRRDGYSKARKPFEGRRKPSNKKNEVDFSPSGDAWWEEPGQVSQQVDASSRTDSRDRYDRPGRPDRRRRMEEEDDDDDDDDEGQGWWQKPEERTLEAYAPGQLSAWQVKRLEEAYTQGRRKVKIQELGQELGLDRSEVIQWMKEFALKPDNERQAILDRRMAEMRTAAAVDVNRMEPRPRNAREQAGLLGSLTPQQQRQEQLQQQQQQQGQIPQGFIPFYTRKELGMIDLKQRRLSADATRTLEMVYSRTPFPSDDVIKGLWDLHRVNRETTLQWLQARREQDGVVTSEQKRSTKKDEIDLSPTRLREAMGNVGFDSNNLLVMLDDGSQTPPPAPEQTQVVAVSGKQLAMLKSSLPSPNKRRGQAINEKMGIKNEGGSLTVGSIQYVKEELPPHVTNKWTAGWRLRKATGSRRLLPLLVKGESQ